MIGVIDKLSILEIVSIAGRTRGWDVLSDDKTVYYVVYALDGIMMHSQDNKKS